MVEGKTWKFAPAPPGMTFLRFGQKPLYMLAAMPDMERWPTGRLLSTAARLLKHAWNEKLGVMGLTHAGVFAALDILTVTGPATQAALARIVRVHLIGDIAAISGGQPAAASIVRWFRR